MKRITRKLGYEILELRCVLTGTLADAVLTDIEANSIISMPQFNADPPYPGIDGSGYAIAILDTGFDLDHPFFGPDMDGNGVADRIVAQKDFIDGDDDASPGNIMEEHGTHVATIAAGFQSGVYSGIATRADLVLLRVCDDSCGDLSSAGEALGWVVEHAAEHNIVAVNMSFGDGANWSTPIAATGAGIEIADNIQQLVDSRILVVSTAGNDFGNPFRNFAQGLSYPGAHPAVISVGATYDADLGLVDHGNAEAHTTGVDRIAAFSQRSSFLDIMAPGADLVGGNATGGTTTLWGTSQAAPLVSGVAVLAQQLSIQNSGNKLTVTEFRDLLSSTGVTINDGDDEDDNVTNTGLDFKRLDAKALLEALHVATWMPGDFDLDQDTGPDVNDIDHLFRVIFGMEQEFSYHDLDDNGVVNLEDVRVLIEDIFGTYFGDADLDGDVDSADLNILALNWQQSVSTWADGDFNGDGVVDSADMNLLGLNWQNGV